VKFRGDGFRRHKRAEGRSEKAQIGWRIVEYAG
jgi:hypothetical protein